MEDRMKKKPGSGTGWTLIAFLAASLMAGPLAAAEPATLPAKDGIETFDKAWTIIRDTHFDATLNGVDWDSVREELRPRAVLATDQAELRAILREMLQRLGQSHFALIPSNAVDADLGATGGEGDLGMEIRMLDDQLIVTFVEEGQPAWSGGIRPGWILTSVGENQTADWLKSIRENPDWRGEDIRFISAGTAFLTGTPGSSVTLGLTDSAGTSRTIELQRRQMPGESVKLGNLPPFMTRFESREIDHGVPAIAVGVIDFNAWMMPVARQFDNAVEQFRGKDGMVIDLRGNPGGVGGMVMGIAGHFYTAREELGTFTTRTQTMIFKANPRTVTHTGKRVQPYAGPLAILIDRMSASTSEMFAGGMQETGRVKVFGRTTAGMVLPAFMDRLPNNDVLYHAIADYRTPSGILVEGRGVIPDETIELSRDDLLAGRDRTLEAALDWIASEQEHRTED
jgi:carboxyl-terminal processing protease